MTWIFHDGGRHASGFVGHTGDCVVRAVAIATGRAYRDVYAELGELNGKSPREGVFQTTSHKYLEKANWKWVAINTPFLLTLLPMGVVIVNLQRKSWRSGHVAAVVDRTVYDTWDWASDSEIELLGYWSPPEGAARGNQHLTTGHELSDDQKLTQDEFDKVMRRLRAMNRTATNHASTEGERRNALRAMQEIMLRHNVRQEDLEKPNERGPQFTNMACPVNGRRKTTWESMLAQYLVEEVFTDVQRYLDSGGHRTLFWFYGPRESVCNCIELFRELLLTIAAQATMMFKGYARGSGASYAEGFVRGLPRASTEHGALTGHGAKTDHGAKKESGPHALSFARSLSVRQAATKWLEFECGIRLQVRSSRGRYARDSEAERRGQADGAKQAINLKIKTLRIDLK